MIGPTMIGSTVHRESPRREKAGVLCCLVIVMGMAGMAGLSATLTACAAPRSGQSGADAIDGLRADYRRRALSVAMNEYAAEFAAVVEGAADAIAASADSSDVRRNALLWKMNAIPRARVACFRYAPLAAQFDMWTFALQMEAFFVSGAGREVFGDQQPLAIEASRRLVSEIREIGLRSAESPEALDRVEAEQIMPWVEANPIQSLSFDRRSSIMRYAELTRDQGGSLAQIASMEENFAKLMVMLRVYLAEIPRHARWQAQLLVDETLDGAKVGDAVGAIDRIAASAEVGSAFAESAPELVRTEREAIINAIDEQRALILEDVDRIRTETLEQVGYERAIVMKSVEERVEEVIEALGDVRAALTADLDRIVAEAVAGAVADGSVAADEVAVRTVDRVFIRLGLLAIIGVVLAPIVARVYVRVWLRGS